MPADDGPPELRRLAAAFNEMADTVADALDRQRSFVSHASHQLRNPLTALRLRVEDLGADLTDDEAREGTGSRWRRPTGWPRCSTACSPWPAPNAASTAWRRSTPGRSRAARVVAWQPVAARREVTLRYVRPPEPIRVRAVATALDQALDALIDNAVKFSGRGVHGRGPGGRRRRRRRCARQRRRARA